MNPQILLGDCLEVLAGLPSDSVDSCITDPPYGLGNTSPAQYVEALTEWARGNRAFVPSTKAGFMGKDWDSFVPPPAVWDEVYRVLKPGGHAFVFAGTRTIGIMETALRFAGFDVRDSIAWMYGSGFPKSLDVSKAIDKAAGATREVVGPGRFADRGRRTDNTVYSTGTASDSEVVTAPATEEAREWSGWGTALKPAFEPILVVRKPIQGTVAANTLTWGTGGLNIDATRIGNGSESKARIGEASQDERYTEKGGANFAAKPGVRGGAPNGRWPANVILDEDQAAALDKQSGYQRDGVAVNRNRRDNGANYDASSYRITKTTREDQGYGSGGGASRFFYVAKAPKRERPSYVAEDGETIQHETVKPLALMRWICRLGCRPGGTIIDPFGGSGTTAEAAILEGMTPIIIEQHEPYHPLIRIRVDRATEEKESTLL